MISTTERLQPKAVIETGGSGDFKMSGFGMSFATVLFLLVFLTGRGSALISGQPSYPTLGPNDPYYQGRMAVLSQKSENCEAKVIHECSDHSQGLLKTLESGSQHIFDKECDALQATIDCLSVPRCPGNLLRTFRYFVLVTALSLSKASNACSRLDVKTLQGYVSGVSMPCEGMNYMDDECHRRCQCHDGDLTSCYRIRKEFTTMSLTERRRFIEVLKWASTSPRHRNAYETLTALHSRIPSKFLHHMPQIFLPWHRWYLLEFENFLRQIDCRVTIPYWNWSRVAEHWTRGSVWSPASHGLGGNGVLPDRCVMDGPFRKSEFNLPLSVGGGLLEKRVQFVLQSTKPRRHPESYPA
ncbi:hypothetical protein OS493_018814 [Desmophyllum pertusum]|uniref:Tyrosinase copper-binding domain-containing protein n=1 Tax=Desmophyllum pertusum TaxID=174260 RepID=A0A9X0CXD2_9CNID|nr:hypothetical protein OS493_018814 [Desmophyllum pertusum]